MKKQFWIAAVLSAALLFTGCDTLTNMEQIDVEQAKAVALAALELSGTEISYMEAELKVHNGQKYYDVDIVVDGVEYDFDIDANTGVIIARDTDDDGQPIVKSITMDEAKAIALADAGITAEDVSQWWREELEEEDGKAVYSLRFMSAEYGYAYQIDAADGDILDKNVVHGKSLDYYTNGDVIIKHGIGETAAWEIVLADAGVTAEDVIQKTCVVDMDDGIMEYRLDFRTAEKSYEYEIDVYNGDIYSSWNPNLITDLIGMDRAWEIALADAGLTEEEIKDSEGKLDMDDGELEYELYFCSADGSRSYDYEINARVGNILSSKIGKPVIKAQPTNAEPAESATSAAVAGISAEEAKAIALAQVPGAGVEHIRDFETDVENGKIEYEGEIVYNGMEYEFEIDGYSGAIRSWEVEKAD